MRVIFEIKISKEFKDQVDKCLSTQFNITTSQQLKKKLKQENTHVLLYIMFYNNSKSLVFKVLDFVVYSFTDKYFYVDYWSLQREPKLLFPHQKQVNNNFDVQKEVSVILPILSFLILKQASLDLMNVPLRFKKHINDINMFEIDYIMSFSTAVTSVVNFLKNIYLCVSILDKSTSAYYNNNNDNFELLFQKYTSSAVDNIYHP